MKIPAGDLYVSSVAGHIVGRFGSSRGTTKGGAIGVYPDSGFTEDGKYVFRGMKWDEKEIVRVPRAEYLAHIKEYDGALDAKALVLRTEKDFVAQEKAREADEKKAVEDAKKEAEALEKSIADAAAKAVTTEAASADKKDK